MKAIVIFVIIPVSLYAPFTRAQNDCSTFAKLFIKAEDRPNAVIPRGRNQKTIIVSPEDQLPKAPLLYPYPSITTVAKAQFFL